MTVAPQITTAEQLLKAGDIGRCELIRGALRMMTPAGYPHGKITYRVAQMIGTHVDSRQLGDVVGAETGFRIQRNPDTVLAPDVAFIERSRAAKAPPQGYFPGPPDLAVEVLSPNDTASEVLDKVQQWLAAGAVAVWIVDPERKTVAIYRADQPVRVYAEHEIIDNQQPLPDLRVKVAEIFT